MSDAPELLLELHTPIPDLIATGAGTVLYLAGSCVHQTQPIRQLEILVGGQAYPVLAHSVSPSELPPEASSANALNHDSHGSFWAITPLLAVTSPTSVELWMRAVLGNGRAAQRLITTLHLVNALPTVTPSFATPPAELPLVAICMATHNPPPALFRRQIRSLREQTYPNWVCVISDDASEPERLADIRQVISEDRRFLLSPSPSRLGTFHNFERSLALAPANAQYLALADQDDYWYPEKLQKLLAQFDEKTTLVHSDMRIINESGEVVSETFWTVRENNYRDFTSLLLANTVTGASSIFVSRLRDRILPFPPQLGNLFHDHWIACVAMGHGELKYVDLPLYDYVQHGSNVIGHYSAAREPLHKILYWMLLEITNPQGRRRLGSIYFESVLPLLAMARVMLLRGGGQIKSGRRAVLERLARLDGSWLNLAWLFVRGLRNWRSRSATMGAEYHLFLGVFWKLCLRAKSPQSI